MSRTEPYSKHQRRIVVAVFAEHDTARTAVERLIREDFPMDSVSLLGKVGSAGDDMLGIYYDGIGERMKSWCGQGALWGALWGLLASAAGMFVVPGLGAILAAGPVVEAIAAALAGATITGGAMAGAAALSQLAVALHRMGVPEDRLHQLHEAIERGHYVVILRCGTPAEAERWRQLLTWQHAQQADDFPYVG